MGNRLRDLCFHKAGQACTQAEIAATGLQDAVISVRQSADIVSENWRGNAGNAMYEGLNVWASKANVLSQRIQAIAAQMRASQQYDFSLWPNEEDT